jgi:integrase
MATWDNFTADRIARFQCEKGKQQTIFWDGKTPGLGLRVTKGGKKSFIFETWLHRKSLRVTIGDAATWPIDGPIGEARTARAEARRLKTLTDQGIDPRQQAAEQLAKAEAAQAKARSKSAMVSDAWTVYLEHHEKRWGARHMADHRNLSQEGGATKKRGEGKTVQGVLRPLLNMRMTDINAAALAAWQAEEAQTRPNNARQGFEMFRAFWRWCASRPEYAAAIDTSAVESKDLRAEVPSRKNKRFDVLQRAQLADWFDAVRGLSNPVVSAYLQGLLLTGARREELAPLRWEDVDFKWNSLWVKDKVAEEGRKIPLTPYLRTLLLDLKRINETPPPSHRILHGKKIENDLKNWKPSPWVFFSKGAKTGRIAEPRIPHNRALAIAGLGHVTLHGLRRSFASLAEWTEMPRGVVAQIMGHAPNATAERHYINRPLELLAVWHGKYEAWILKEAGIEFDAKTQQDEEQQALRSVA